MPYIFVRSVMNERNHAQTVFEVTTTYIDFHLSFDQSRSHLCRELQKVESLKPLNDITLGAQPHSKYSQGGQYDYVQKGHKGAVYRSGSPGWKTYQTNAPAYVVLNALETCDYKVVAASSTPIGQYS